MSSIAPQPQDLPDVNVIPVTGPNGQASQPSPAVQPLADDDPFSASNFAPEGEEVPLSSEDIEITVGVPSEEEFVFVSSDPRHHIKGTLLVVKATEGFGKSYFLLTPAVAAWAKSQASLKKFVKTFHIFLYNVSEGGGYGLWLVPDKLDSWSVSEMQVVAQAKTIYTRRYTVGKTRKGHTSDWLLESTPSILPMIRSAH